MKQLQSFLGLGGYYRRHIRDFSKIAQPLFNLLKKENSFIFDENCKRAFNQLKTALTTDPVLRPPDFNREFNLYTDSSFYSLGAILSQKDDEGREYVVAYASRLLKESEKKYAISEKECLSCIWATKYFRVYLFGRRFNLYTDHRSLLWLMNIKDENGRLGRWPVYVQGLDMNIIFRPGRIHSNVDVLSRPVLAIEIINDKDPKNFNKNGIVDQNFPRSVLASEILKTNDKEEDEDSGEKGLDVYENEPLIFFIKNGKHIPGLSSNVVKRINRLIPNFSFDGKDIRFRKRRAESWKIIPPPEQRVELITKAHLVGHFQVQTTFDRLKNDYFWKKMRDQIANVIKLCEV